MRRRWFARTELWVIVGAAVVLAVGIALFYEPNPPPRGVFGEDAPSTTHRGNGGLKALYLVLERLKFDVTRVSRAEDLFKDRSRSLAVIAPEPAFGWRGETAERFGVWLRSGGSALFVPSRLTSTDFDRMGLPVRVRYGSGRTPETAVSGPEKKYVETVVVRSSRRFKVDDDRLGGVEVLLEDAAGIIALGTTVGQGRLILFSDAYPFTNVGLKHVGNATFIAMLLARLASGKRVAFDEAHHTLGDKADEPNIWDIMTAGPGEAIIVLALALFLAWAISAGRRFGAPVRAVRVERRSTLEFVQAYAALVHRANRDGLVVRFIADAFRREAAKRLGVARAPKDADLASRFAARWGGDAGAIARTLADATAVSGGSGGAGPSVDERRVLDIARRLESLKQTMIRAGAGRRSLGAVEKGDKR